MARAVTFGIAAAFPRHADAAARVAVRSAAPSLVDVMLADDLAHVERPLGIRTVGLPGGSPLVGLEWFKVGPRPLGLHLPTSSRPSPMPLPPPQTANDPRALRPRHRRPQPARSFNR